MIICTSITEPYLTKSKPFFESVKENFDGKRICFTIGFKTEIDGWETVEVKPEHDWRPANRSDYYSLQHGEFINHYDFGWEEMILFCDSDMVLQRKWDLEFPPTDAVWVTQCSYPQKKLFEVIKNIGLKKNQNKFYDKYKAFLQREFCTCWMLAKCKTWRKIYDACKSRYDMLEYFDHHAAWQLLINTAISNELKSVVAPPLICNASWYEGTTAFGSPLMVEDKQGEKTVMETVYFNHTKFN